MKILVLYNATQTYTNTVYEHLNSFTKYSRHRFFFCHNRINGTVALDLNNFDAVIIHYSIRLPFDQLSTETAHTLQSYSGLKALFIQDEYDHTMRTWHWINNLGIQLVFTVVPENNISRIYPAEKLPGVRFVSNLTGYVPESLPAIDQLMSPSSRSLIIGYRGRPLPIRYGQLSQEKTEVGRIVKKYCAEHSIKHDIEWSEEARIYGPAWYEFMASCRSMLGSESGSNAFDWDGTLASQIDAYKQQHPTASDDELYSAIIEKHDQHGLMNQISPRVFESISLRTVLVLFEGEYSGVLTPGIHFIPLKKDGSNLCDVIKLLEDAEYVDAMADRAYTDIIVTRKYSYSSFVSMVDRELSNSFANLNEYNNTKNISANNKVPYEITTAPICANAPSNVTIKIFTSRYHNIIYKIWQKIPYKVRSFIKKILKPILYQ